jgi:hypothetical protein
MPSRSRPSPSRVGKWASVIGGARAARAFDINSRAVDPSLGSPTSSLTYDGINANAAEFLWRVNADFPAFTKGFVGDGWLNGGSLDDEDFLAGQVKFLDTYSRLDGNGLIYGTIDLGYDFKLSSAAPRVMLSPFIGVNIWYEEVDAYGARCNRDDVGGFFCGGPPGFIAEPFATKVITNEATWSSLRLGTELTVKLWDRLTLRGDAAVLPVAYLWNYDSHHLRGDLGPVPNVLDTGYGWGYQLEGEVRFDINPCWQVGAGVRYWYAETDGDSEFVHLDTTVQLDDFTSERFGVFGNVTYRFATF